ncbi:MAG: class E sortase [Patescibacteria group bacterium]|nr:class E sortase [Patescibacteria group bacterium]
MNREPKIEELEKLIEHFRKTDREHELSEILERHKIMDRDEVLDVIDDDTHEFHEEAIVINKLAWREGLVRKVAKPFKRFSWLFRNKWYVRFGIYWLSLFFVMFSLLNAPIFYSRLSVSEETTTETKMVTTQELVGGATAKSAPLATGEVIPKGNYLKVGKIKVNAPIVFPKTTDEATIQKYLTQGVVHYHGTANPGQVGNTFITGHSSNFWWIKGNYNYVFVNLDKLVKGDQAIIYYGGNKYVYEVTGKVVVAPTDVSVLGATDTPTLSLMTCTPPGTNWKRLVVKFKQVAPKYVKPRLVERTEIVENTVKLPSTDKNSLGAWLLTVWDEIVGVFKS